MRVVKVGGSVLHNAGDYVKCAELALKLGTRVVIVSAMKGVTDALLEAAKSGNEGKLGEALDAAVTAARELGAKEVDVWVDRCLRSFSAYLSSPSPWLLDEIVATGERISARAMAAALELSGLRTAALDGGEAGIVTDDRFGEARPLFDECFGKIGRTLRSLLGDHDVIVVAGFVGATVDGQTTTMGRGASDLTATLVARALGAEVLYLVTDAPHLMTADPSAVPSARPLKSVGLREADVMAELRVKRFHPLTFKPLLNSSCKVVVGSHPPSGTLVVGGLPPPDLKVVAQRGGSIVFVGRGARRLAEVVAKELKSKVLEVGELHFALAASYGGQLSEAHEAMLKFWSS